MSRTPSDLPVPPPASTSAGAAPRRLSSGALLGGARIVLIEHNGECYPLRHTLRGKLILTK